MLKLKWLSLITICAALTLWACDDSNNNDNDNDTENDTPNPTGETKEEPKTTDTETNETPEPSCSDLSCDSPPAAHCDGDDVVDYENPGTCDDQGEEPTCEYAEESRINCLDTLQACIAGACQDAPIASAGELLVSEVMINPDAVSDAKGEWVEIANTSDHTISLLGLEITDVDENSYVIEETILLAAGEFVVLGKNGVLEENGNVELDLVIDHFGLSNSADQVILKQGEIVIDQVAWESGSVFAKSAGASVQRDFESDTWCESLNAWEDSAGDRGSPGAANHECVEEPEE